MSSTKLWIEFIITTIFFISVVTLNFSIFKINIPRNHKQIALLAITIGTVNYYFKFVLNSPSFLINQIIIYIVALVVLRRYPVLYAFIFALTGSLAVSLIDSIVTVGALQLELATVEEMSSNINVFILLHLITTTICFLVSFLLYKLNFGLSFISTRFSGKHAIKAYNFLWTIILVAGFIALQFANVNFDEYSLHKYIITFITLSLIVSILYAYRQNKRIWKTLNGGTNIEIDKH